MELDADPPMNTVAEPTGRAWVGVVLGGVWILAAVVVATTRFEVLTATHPALLVLTTLVAVVGVILVWRGARQRAIPATRTIGHWLRVAAAVVVSVIVLGATIWLRPFPSTAADLLDLGARAGVGVEATTSRITLTPQEREPQTGFIFQPGARVDARAYVPLLSRVAAEGHLVVIVQQPLAIGFTAIGAPAAVIQSHPEIDTWAVGGHSLGGVAAAQFAQGVDVGVDGLVFWASFPAGEFTADLPTISISGEQDGLSTPEDIEASAADLPDDAVFVEVAGATHAYFGDYGEQPGDGEPTVNRDNAQQQIAAETADFLAGLSSTVSSGRARSGGT
ncbi:alpha/beta hydrolase [Euzebya tangerina]|uniref:alpha/beta hydrolase n=1 Tax=Euzebya tangerina TaxID=591198 RepID=UPI0013C3637F|nr:alpha/beta hydrolase [Euzebya tangerina]